MKLGECIEKAAERMEGAGLAFGHGTSNAFDDAAFLALEVLGLPVDGLEEHFDMAISAAQQKTVEDIVARRIETRKPSSYLVNKAYIQGIPFYVDERVIVPRSFIGEILFSDTLEMLCDPEKVRSVLDLCTGSGCLAILAAHVFPNAQVDAVELSPGAAAVARRNIDESGFKDRVTLFEGDLFAPLNGRTYDLIITNPPYVDAPGMTDLPPEYRHEPEMALAGGREGIDLVRRIINDAPAYLNTGGGLLCEIGRCKDSLEKAYLQTPFLWLETEESSDEVFWLKEFPQISGSSGR